MKVVVKKPKPAQLQPSAPAEIWAEHPQLLPATFQWDPPAILPPTRRDAKALPHILAMDRCLQDLLSWARMLPQAPSVHETPEAVQEFLEHYQDWQHDTILRNDLKISCQAGCGTCCHQYPLGIHAIEVLHIHALLKAAMRLEEILPACIARAANYRDWQDAVAKSYGPDGWDPDAQEILAQEHDFDDGQPCPFLDTFGSCSIHIMRPLTCRMFLASTPPCHCSSELNTHPDTIQFTLPPDESIALRMERLDRTLDWWGHDGSLLGSLVKLARHEQDAHSCPP
jgi:Fe-S-cluster containining protein